MYGSIGKKRTRFGRWADKERLTQQMLIKITGVNKNTMTELCNNEEYNPHIPTKTKVVSGLRRNGFDVEMADFW
ncbi:transcriptional regulator [Bacillus sp. 3255]|uniref:transcriptional regulator n=1 Tax=Bacillus sp. 3255 TaxID=2817904 RepID=UPI00285D8E39|nr:transcriptional regulator [Bacillus sp. 3255]MDR6884852.1 DNA-binding XRE family transcriptional regulator [Bacillus sp. 3255]